jgi:hypothetical protein
MITSFSIMIIIITITTVLYLELSSYYHDYHYYYDYYYNLYYYDSFSYYDWRAHRAIVGARRHAGEDLAVAV